MSHGDRGGERGHAGESSGTLGAKWGLCPRSQGQLALKSPITLSFYTASLPGTHPCIFPPLTFTVKFSILRSSLSKNWKRKVKFLTEFIYTGEGRSSWAQCVLGSTCL